MRHGTRLSNNFRKWLAATAFVAVLFLCVAPLGYAQTSGDVAKTSLAISPVTFVLTANPGDVITNKVKVTNSQGNKSVAVEMEVKPFTGTETGQAVILDEENPAYSLGKWVTVSPQSFTLEPKETQVVEYTITIPADAEAGGRYASILAKSGEGEVSGTGATTVQKVGSLVLLRVNGTVSYGATVKDFKTVRSGQDLEQATSQLNFERAPVTFYSKIANTGKSHILPSGFVVVSNMFGKKVTDIPFPERFVLPGNDRVVEAMWDDAKIGYYTATLLLNYGDKNEQLTATTTFLVFPWKTGVPIILGVVIVVWFIIARRKRLAQALGVIFSRQ